MIPKPEKRQRKKPTPLKRSRIARKAPRKPQDKRLSRKRLRVHAWKLMSLYIRSRGFCELGKKCGGRTFSIPELQACHGFGKKAYPATYFDPANVFAGCPEDHSYFSWKSIEFDMWMREYMGEETYNLVRAKALSNERVDIPAVIAWLEKEPTVIAALAARNA